jgi:Lar family restriction alleviation protein
MQDELKACPFCGGAPRAENDPFESASGSWYVTCDPCGLVVPHYTTRDAAAKAWNTRALPIADGAEVEAVARALYATSCALDPVDANREPNWGRGGYKTEAVYWHGLARAAIAAIPSRGPTFPEGEAGARECLAEYGDWSEDGEHLIIRAMRAFRGSGAMLPRATEDGMREALEEGFRAAVEFVPFALPKEDTKTQVDLAVAWQKIDAARTALSSIPAGREGGGS